MGQKQRMAHKINARSLILDLLFAEPTVVMNTRHFLQAASLFAISDNSTRVALTRLSAEGLLESVGRGQYRLTENAKEISEPVANRANGPTLTRPWNGSYLAVHTGALGRVDRSALNHRERTLRLNGFRELQNDLFIRPDNLAESFSATEVRLFNTGLDSSVPVFIISQFNDATSKKIPALWDTRALNQRYQKTSQHIQQWLSHYEQLELDIATRESLTIGRQAIPLLMTDPLLPEPFVDTKLREQFAADVQTLDKVGHTLWSQFFQRSANNDEGQQD